MINRSAGSVTSMASTTLSGLVCSVIDCNRYKERNGLEASDLIMILFCGVDKNRVGFLAGVRQEP